MRRVMIAVLVTLCSFALVALASIASPGGARSAVAADDPGAKLFEIKCSSCHGKDGKGKTKTGEKLKIKDLTDPAVQAEFTDEKAEKAINEGIEREGKLVMKPIKGLKPEDIKALVKYVRTLKGT